MKVNVINGFVVIQKSIIDNNTLIHFCNNEVIGGRYVSCNKDELKYNIEYFNNIIEDKEIETITINKCIITKEQLYKILEELMNIYSE